MPLLVLALTHSPAQAGFMTAVREAPYLLFSLPAGALIDRWNRKITMIFCDLVRWPAMGSVPLAFALGHLTLVHLYIVAFIEGTAYVFFSLAQIAALPQVVAPAHLPRAYALDNITEYVGTLLGPSLGAFIIGLASLVEMGAILAFLADSISYLVSVISMLFIRVSFQMERATETRRALYKEIAEGLRFLWRQRLLRIPGNAHCDRAGSRRAAYQCADAGFRPERRRGGWRSRWRRRSLDKNAPALRSDHHRLCDHLGRRGADARACSFRAAVDCGRWSDRFAMAYLRGDACYLPPHGDA